MKHGSQFVSLDDYIKDDGSGVTSDPRSRNHRTSIFQSTLLFDSMISYIAKSVAEKEEENIYNEETEDFKTSEGQDTGTKISRSSMKTKTIDDLRKQVYKMLDKYMFQIEQIALNRVKPKTIDATESLKKFMTAIFFLNRIFS